MYTVIHNYTTLAKVVKNKWKESNPVTLTDKTNKPTYILTQDTWMPSLENWGSGLKISFVTSCTYVTHKPSLSFSLELSLMLHILYMMMSPLIQSRRNTQI